MTEPPIHRLHSDNTPLPCGPQGESPSPGPGGSGPTATSVQLVRLCAELARIVLSDPLGLVLQQIADLAVEAIPEAEEVSVTLMERGKARSVVFTGNLAAGLDERQYRDGFGPCMDAAMTGETITIEDTAHSSTYPAFGRQAHRHGVNHTLSVGMATSPQAAGAINIYSTTPSGPFAPASRDSAAAFASYAAIALVNVATVSAATTEAGQLRQAMASRASIEQAKGILMRDRHCSADEAFAILRDYSSRSNRKLHDIVQDILDDAS